MTEDRTKVQPPPVEIHAGLRHLVVALSGHDGSPLDAAQTQQVARLSAYAGELLRRWGGLGG